MNNKTTASSEWEKNTVKTTVRLGFWTLGWVVTMAIANFGPKFIWQFNNTVTVVAILLNLAVGAGMILANKRHLNGLDELQQKIQLEAMALSLGVGLIVGLGYSNLDVSNIISADAEISHLVILMGLTYLAGVIAGTRKYR
jgi:hypothetical protein